MRKKVQSGLENMEAKLKEGTEGKLLSAPFGLHLGSVVRIETSNGQEKVGYLAELYCTAS